MASPRKPPVTKVLPSRKIEKRGLDGLAAHLSPRKPAAPTAGQAPSGTEGGKGPAQKRPQGG